MVEVIGTTVEVVMLAGMDYTDGARRVPLVSWRRCFSKAATRSRPHFFAALGVPGALQNSRYTASSKSCSARGKRANRSASARNSSSVRGHESPTV